MTSPMFDGLNRCEPRYWMTYFVSSEKAATPANTYHAWKLQWSSGVVVGHAEDERDTAAGEHRAGRPHEGAAGAEGDGHAEDRGGQDRRQDLRDADLEVQADLPEDVDRDDDGGHVQPRIAELRQEHGVRVPLSLMALPGGTDPSAGPSLGSGAGWRSATAVACCCASTAEMPIEPNTSRETARPVDRQLAGEKVAWLRRSAVPHARSRPPMPRGRVRSGRRRPRPSRRSTSPKRSDVPM